MDIFLRSFYPKLDSLAPMRYYLNTNEKSVKWREHLAVRKKTPSYYLEHYSILISKNDKLVPLKDALQEINK